MPAVYLTVSLTDKHNEKNAEFRITPDKTWQVAEIINALATVRHTFESKMPIAEYSVQKMNVRLFSLAMLSSSRAFLRGVMGRKLVTLYQLRRNSEFYPQRLPYNFGLSYV